MRPRMSPPGRPKGEYRSAQREGFVISPPGRPKGEYRSAQREGLRSDNSGAGQFLQVADCDDPGPADES